MARKKRNTNKLFQDYIPEDVEDLHMEPEEEVPSEEDDTLDCTEFMGGNPYSYLDGDDSDVKTWD